MLLRRVFFFPPPAYLWLASFVGRHSTVPGLARGVRVKKKKF